MSRKIEVQILGDSKQLEAALGRAQQKTSRFGSALAAGAKVGAAGLLGLGVAAKIGFDELEQGQRVAAQTNAVIKSTGGAANVTAAQVDKLATSLLNKSGVDDEAIASSENLLLTFRNVHNEAGRGNDIFNQATKATLDLSVAMGKDLNSSTILVGKALNDPIKGMTALRRVGVSLSSNQEDLVKHLVNTGHTMQAQKIILGELNKEFGGSAEAAGKTLPGQLNILKETFKNLAAEVVADLLPAMTTMIGVIQNVTQWMRRNKGASEVLVVAIGALSTALIGAKVAYAIANSGLIRFIRSERVATVASRILSGALWLVNAALDANPVVLITAGIIALGVALVIAYRKSATFRAVVGHALEAVKGIVQRVVAVWKFEWGVAADATAKVWGWVNRVISAVQQLIGWISRIHFPSIPSSIGGVHIPGLGTGLLGHTAIPGVGTEFGATFGLSGKGAQGRPIPPIAVNLHMDKKLVYSVVVDADKDARRQNGRSLLA